MYGFWVRPLTHKSTVSRAGGHAEKQPQDRDQAATKFHRSGVICYRCALCLGSPVGPKTMFSRGAEARTGSFRACCWAVVGRLFLAFCGRLRWSMPSAVHFGAFCVRNSMDIRGDLLSCLMFGDRSRWSGKSLDTRGELLFVLMLISLFFVPANRWLLGVISC